MTYWKPVRRLSRFQERWLAAAVEPDGSYDVTPEKIHLIPYLLMSSDTCTCNGTACIRCIGPRFKYHLGTFVPVNCPTDQIFVYPIRTSLGDFFANSTHELIGLIGEALLRGQVPLVHTCCPPLENHFIAGAYGPEPAFSAHVLVLPDGILAPPWRPDLDADTAEFQLKDLSQRLEASNKHVEPVGEGPFQRKVAALRQLGFKFCRCQRLNRKTGIRMLSPPSDNRRLMGDPVVAILDSLRHRQHQPVPLRLFSLCFDPEPTFVLVVLWRAHNRATLKATLASLSVEWTFCSNEEVLQWGLSPDMQVMHTRTTLEQTSQVGSQA